MTVLCHDDCLARASERVGGRVVMQKQAAPLLLLPSTSATTNQQMQCYEPLTCKNRHTHTHTHASNYLFGPVHVHSPLTLRSPGQAARDRSACVSTLLINWPVDARARAPLYEAQEDVCVLKADRRHIRRADEL